METRERSVYINEAKIILLTAVFTVLVSVVLVYTFRGELVSYIFNQLAPEFAEMIPPEKVHTSNEDRVIAAIAAVNPAVVSVVVTKDVPVYEQYYETLNPWGLFGGFSVPRIREKGTEEREVGGGSGFIVSSDGLIVTNRHVVEDEDARYSIVLSDGTVYGVRVVDRDPQLDIAILAITELPNAKLSYVGFGDSENLQLGQTVIAIGNALAEFQNTVSLGVVSGIGRSIVASDLMGNAEQLNQVIQTDAAINPGNSGGPLLNLDGKVVGVNVATSRGADNIGFALPAHIVQQVVTSVQEYGEIIRPLLGVRYVMIDEAVQAESDLDQAYGALIIAGADDTPGVEVGSPAAEAGLQEGDIIVSIDGISLLSRDLATELRNKSVGQAIELEIVRDGERQTVVATLDRAL